MLDIDALKERFLNLEFDRNDFELDPAKAIVVARMSGEQLPQFTDPDHPEFQATPALIGSLTSSRHLPVSFPDVGGIPMDGGKAVTCLAPVPLGEPLTGKSHIHDIYDKTGRSGRMIFLVSRMELFNAAGEHLASNDSRLVIREHS